MGEGRGTREEEQMKKCCLTFLHASYLGHTLAKTKSKSKHGKTALLL
jgi:hypothetical protein